MPPLDLETLPTPIVSYNPRSALEVLRRMFLLRWSTGQYLTAIAGNYGLSRPPLGFSDDEIFRSVAQVIMADYKIIPNAFFQLLEIILGPAEDLFFQVRTTQAAGKSYVHIEPFGSYFEVDPASLPAVTPFTPGERIIAVHPKTGVQFEFIFKYMHAAAPYPLPSATAPDPPRLYFEFSRTSPEGEILEPNLTFIGNQSGATCKNISQTFNVDLTRFPIYSRALLYSPDQTDPLNPSLSTNQEPTILVTPDAYRQISRTTTELAVDRTHPGLLDPAPVFPPNPNPPYPDIIFIQGGCWELFSTKARQLIIKILCPELYPSGLPGNSYLHPNPWMESLTFNTVQAGDTQIKIEDIHTINTDLLTFPRLLLLDPDNQTASLRGGTKIVSAASFNSVTRTFTLTAPLPANTQWVRNTKIAWLQQLNSTLSSAANPTDLQLFANVPNETPHGVWMLNPSGPNEELVFVVATSYQYRRLVTSIVSGTTQQLEFERPFDPFDLSITTHVRIKDNAGNVGIFPIQSLTENRMTFAAPLTISVDVETNLAIVELVDSNGGSKLTLDPNTPVQNTHAPGIALAYLLGTSALEPTWNDHLPQGDFPPSSPPNGKFPGPHLFEPAEIALYNEQETGIVHAEIDTTDLNDCRIYLAKTELSEKFDPYTAPIFTTVTVGGVVYQIRKMHVADASSLPTQTQIDAWRVHPENPHPGLPVRLQIASEGGFGRNPVYYWGKGATALGEEHTIFVSGMQRIHQIGSTVASYHSEIPILAVSPALNPWGSSPGFEIEEGQVFLDFGYAEAEVAQYDACLARTPTQALLSFERGFVPQFPHDINKISNLEPAAGPLGVTVFRADQQAIPRVDGFSFPFYLGGNAAYFRLRFVAELVRAAGVQVFLYDDKDRLINI